MQIVLTVNKMKIVMKTCTNVGFYATNNHTIIDCVPFQRLDNNEKIRVLMRNGICFNRLRGIHMAKYCKVQRTCDIMDNNKRCGRFHHHSLHQAYKEGILFHSTSHVRSNPQVKTKALLMISRVIAMDVQ